MVKKSVLLHFGASLVDKPIITGLIRDYDVSVNSLHDIFARKFSLVSGLLVFDCGTWDQTFGMIKQCIFVAGHLATLLQMLHSMCFTQDHFVLSPPSHPQSGKPC